jgi:Glycosyl hydrolase family 46
MIALNKDESGRTLLVEEQKSGSPEVKAQATSALDALNKARTLVNMSEFGTDRLQQALQKAESSGHPEEVKIVRDALNGYGPYEGWAQSQQKSLGTSSPLVLAILLDAAVQGGESGAGKMSAEASKSQSSPLDTTDKERRWSERFLDVRSQFLDGVAARLPSLAPAFRSRIDRLREHVRAGDWDLTPEAFLSAGNTMTGTGK